MQRQSAKEYSGNMKKAVREIEEHVEKLCSKFIFIAYPLIWTLADRCVK
jgi:hypothetical protein